MDLESTLAILGILASAGVAYHLAWKQRLVGSVRARLALGFAARDEPLDERWAVCLIVPEAAVSHYVAVVPLSIRNNDSVVLRSSRLHVYHARELSILTPRHMMPELYKGATVYGKPSILGIHGVMDYELPVVRRDEDASVGHTIVVPADMLRAQPDQILIGTIGYQLTAENAKRQEHLSYLAIALCKEREMSHEEAERLTQALHDQSKRDLPPKSVVVWKWRSPQKPLEVRSCVVVQPFWSRVKDHPIAIEEALAFGRPTQYVDANMDVNILPGVLPRR